jgi:hypothetical protein
MDPQTVRLSLMCDQESVFGHLHDCRAVAALSSLTCAVSLNAIQDEQFRPKEEFKKRVVIYNGDRYQADQGLLCINPKGDILVYCSHDMVLGFETEGRVGFKDITFGYTR